MSKALSARDRSPESLVPERPAWQMETSSLACEYPCLGWGGFFDEADCSQLPALDAPIGSQLARVLSLHESATSSGPFSSSMPFSPTHFGDVLAAIPAPVVSCTTDSVLGTLSASVHPPVDGVCFLSFHMNMGDWCFSYVPRASTLEEAVRWFCDRMPESAFLSLMSSRLGPLLLRPPAEPCVPTTSLSLVAYDFDFENYAPQLTSVADLEFGQAYFPEADTLDIVHGFSSLPQDVLWGFLSQSRRDLVESLQGASPEQVRWHALVAWHLLSDLPQGPSRLPVTVDDSGLSLAEMETLVSLHAEWLDSAPALVDAVRALS